MSVRRLAEIQPESFAFTPQNAAWADEQIAKYPEGRQASAVLSLLWRAQKQNDYWLPKAAIEEVARQLDMPYIRVLEVATFYTMFNLEPVGRYFIQMCGTTPCMLEGSDGIKAVLERRVGPPRRVTADGNFSWLEVECLGACCNAPMVQINDDYYEDLTPANFEKLLDDLVAGKPVAVGSQIGRRTSEPVGGLTSLVTFYGKDGMGGPGFPERAPADQRAHRDEGVDAGTDVPGTPPEPAHARRSQEEAQEAGTPDKGAETGTRRTKPTPTDGAESRKAAQSKAKSGTKPRDSKASPKDPGAEG